MIVNDVLERFVERTPVAVMARIVLEQAINADWVNEVFEKHRQRQYTRELLFSTVVDLMSKVVLRVGVSLNAVAEQALQAGELPVSKTALYEKVKHTEPAVIRALVQGSAERLAPVMRRLRGMEAPGLAGSELRLIDGNHLPASEKRLSVLRDWPGAALPGQALVVYDPKLAMVVDMVPSEDGHAQERALMPAILQTSQEGQLWIGDRNFCTRPILGALAANGASFLIREHGANARPSPRGSWLAKGRVATGEVYEQPVELTLDTGQNLALRRVELRLDTPTQDGDESIRVLTNRAPERLDACAAATLYRRRWTIEWVFQRLESVLHSEVRSLGYPGAALLAFGVAIVAYNVLSVLQAALEAAHNPQDQGIELSSYYLAHEVTHTYHGMMVAVPPAEWEPYAEQTPAQLAQTLLQIAEHATPWHYRKHSRKPKSKRQKKPVSRAAAQRHVATSRVLREAGLL